MKSYAEKEDIEQYVLKLIRFYIREMFKSYGNLVYNRGINRDDIESDVCFYVFKTNIKGETFIDKMSKITTLKHLRAFVKRSVINQINTKIREQNSKPIFVDLDFKLTEDYGTQEDENLLDNYNMIADPHNDTELSALMQTAVNSIKIDKYSGYLFEYEEGKYKTLDSKDLILMIQRQRSACGMSNYVISKRTGKNIKRAILQRMFLVEREKLKRALNETIDVKEIIC